MITSNLITNESENTLANRLSALISKYEKVDICAISGYFNAKAFEWLANQGENLGEFALILGNDSPKNSNFDIAFYFKNDPFNFAVHDVFDQLNEIRATKIAINFLQNDTIKIYALKKPNILVHSKMYFLYSKASENIEQYAIVGSSNFTASGLGLHKYSSNKELNLLCDSKQATKDCKIYFDALLSECERANESVISALDSRFFYHTPQDVIDKIRQLYGSELQDLDSKEMRSLDKGAEIFGLYDFQKFAAAELLKRLKTYGVAMLSDPVGSGKTLTALSVAFAYSRVVIITPPKLKSQWESYFSGENDARIDMNLTIFSYDEALKAKDFNASKIKNAHLVIIDESHHFRNDNATYRRFKDKLSADSEILCISATPINNNYKDLGHQLSLKKGKIRIEGKDCDPIKICKEADLKAKKREEGAPLVLSAQYYALCNLIFSRSSKDIENFLRTQNKSLPKQNKKIKTRSSIPQNINFSLNDLLYAFDLDENKGAISLCIYDPFQAEFLPEKIIESLRDKNAENLGEYSTPRGFLCMKLIKALESSIDAFLQTLGTIIKYHDNFLRIYGADSRDSRALSEIDSEDSSEFDDEEVAFPQRLRSVIEGGFLGLLSDEFIAQVKSDAANLKHLRARFNTYKTERDFQTSGKFLELQKIIENLGAKIHSEKLLIFTESIITADNLCTALSSAFKNLNIASITGETSKSEFLKRRELFSPKSLHYTLDSNEREIDILVATDCLSEGQNLQDCANFLNWDIAFNPVRSIQRVGRIWRIGSLHKVNNITHFLDLELDEYIALESKLRYKLDAASSATQIDSPFSNTPINNEAHLKEREKAYESIKNDLALDDSDSRVESIATLLERAATKTPPKSLNDGIFSIALDESAPKNRLFCALEGDDKKPYFCLWDMDKNALTPSVSENDATNNVKAILALKNCEKLFKDEFDKLENLTNIYSDLSALTAIFEALLGQLNNAIISYEAKIAGEAKSDGGLFFDDERRFRLIAWLLINPNFEILASKGQK